MAEEALQTEPTADTPAEGAPPAVPPAADSDPAGEKTPEQLDAEKAAEAKKQADEEAEEASVRKKPWFQRRIDEMTKLRREAERRAQKLEEMLGEVIGQIKAGTPPSEHPPAQPPAEFVPTRPRPTREQFEYDEDKYIDAVTDWKYEQREALAAHERRMTEQQQTQVQIQKAVEERRVKTLQEGAQKYPDFDEVVRSLPAAIMNPEMALCVLQTRTPADIAYHLGKNPDEAERISRLAPIEKAIALGELQAAILANQKKTTSAPPPPNPIGGREPSPKSESQMSMDEWLKARRAGKITGKN